MVQGVLRNSNKGQEWVIGPSWESSAGTGFLGSARWYAVQTLPRREVGAATQLEAQCYRVFLPRHLKTVRHARRFKTVYAPFFPRYLFVRLDLSCDRWRSINGTFGVAGLIMEGEKPLAVPPGVVESLRAKLGSNSEANGDLKIGQQVEVMVGPFANLVGSLESFDGRTRVRILLQILGSSARASIAREAVVSISA
jgi:transcription elongation factor/antiterminator RfaH